jgi:hypothetical protein
MKSEYDPFRKCRELDLISPVSTGSPSPLAVPLIFSPGDAAAVLAMMEPLVAAASGTMVAGMTWLPYGLLASCALPSSRKQLGNHPQFDEAP